MKKIQVTCAIISLNNKILVVQRSESMKLPLKWEFPGGKIEKGESEEDCIKREILLAIGCASLGHKILIVNLTRIAIFVVMG